MIWYDMIWSLIAVVEQLNWPAVLVECFEYADEADQWVGCECVRRSRRPGPRSYTALHLQSSRSASAVPSSLSASIQTHCYVMCYAERDLLAIDKFLCHGPGTLLAHVCEQSFTSHVDSYIRAVEQGLNRTTLKVSYTKKETDMKALSTLYGRAAVRWDRQRTLPNVGQARALNFWNDVMTKDSDDHIVPRHAPAS